MGQTMNLFTGIEAEGHQKGKETLFIGDVPVININKLIGFLHKKEITRVYFGANNFRQLPFWFNEFVEKCPFAVSIIAEIKNPDDIPKVKNNRVTFVLYIDINKIQEIKTVKNKTLTWTRLTDMKSWVNQTDDTIYKRDKEAKI